MECLHCKLSRCASKHFSAFLYQLISKFFINLSSTKIFWPFERKKKVPVLNVCVCVCVCVVQVNTLLSPYFSSLLHILFINASRNFLFKLFQSVLFQICKYSWMIPVFLRLGVFVCFWIPTNIHCVLSQLQNKF